MRGRGHRITLVEGRTSIDTHRIAGVSQTLFERPSGVVTRHVPITAHHVVNVLAQPRTLRSFFACSDTKLCGGHEVRPLVQLLQLAVVEYTGKDQATDGVTVSSSTVRVELASRIACRDVHGGEVTNTSNLDVIGGLNEVGSFDCTRWNHSSSISRVGAV